MWCGTACSLDYSHSIWLYLTFTHSNVVQPENEKLFYSFAWIHSKMVQSSSMQSTSREPAPIQHTKQDHPGMTGTLHLQVKNWHSYKLLKDSYSSVHSSGKLVAADICIIFCIHFSLKGAGWMKGVFMYSCVSLSVLIWFLFFNFFQFIFDCFLFLRGQNSICKNTSKKVNQVLMSNSIRSATTITSLNNMKRRWYPIFLLFTETLKVEN